MTYYRIGDLSNIFGLSSEMIRYYEKQGVISPERDRENGYRIYSSWDVFKLLEAIQYKSMEIQLNEIEKMKSADYMDEYTARLKKYRDEKYEEIRYDMILTERLDRMIHRNECVRFNLGRYWIAHTPACLRIPMCVSEKDEYSRVLTDRKTLEKMFTKPLCQFFDSAVEFHEGNEIWYFSIEEEYVRKLGVPLDEAEYCEAKNELYTVVDMGRHGAFSQECLNPVKEYISQKRCEVTGLPRGIICGRGTDEKEYRRYIEVHIPIRL